MRYSIEHWDPEYGTPGPGADLDPSPATVDPEVEVSAAEWAPRPAPALAEASRRILFVDGVLRRDALAWVHDPEGGAPRLGLCASFAAGVLECGRRAKLIRAEVRRRLFSTAGDAETIETPLGDYDPLHVAAETPQGGTGALQAATVRLQEEMRTLEVTLAQGAGEADLLVVDGPLVGRQNLPWAVGYVKTHQRRYLEPPLESLLGRLGPGERTPVFMMTTSWSRFSWYLRLPGPGGHPWAGLVRLEASPGLPPRRVFGLADLSAGLLPRFASSGHREPRAPQNLYPIAGLENALRRRLGDAGLLHRALRVAARAAGSATEPAAAGVAGPALLPAPRAAGQPPPA